MWKRGKVRLLGSQRPSLAPAIPPSKQLSLITPRLCGSRRCQCPGGRPSSIILLALTFAVPAFGQTKQVYVEKSFGDARYMSFIVHRLPCLQAVDSPKEADFTLRKRTRKAEPTGDDVTTCSSGLGGSHCSGGGVETSTTCGPLGCESITAPIYHRIFQLVDKRGNVVWEWMDQWGGPKDFRDSLAHEVGCPVNKKYEKALEKALEKAHAETEGQPK